MRFRCAAGPVGSAILVSTNQQHRRKNAFRALTAVPTILFQRWSVGDQQENKNWINP